MNSLAKIASTKKFDLDYQVSIKDAMAVMNENKNGCAVLLKNFKPIGIITESDIVNALKNKLDLNDKAMNIAKLNIISTSQNRLVEFAFDILAEHNIRRIILVNEIGDYSGIVLQEDLFDHIEDDVYKIDLKISDIVQQNQNILTIDISKSIIEVLSIMQENDIGSLIVTRYGKYVGIITEKDILKLTFLEIDMSEEVSMHMTFPVISIKENSLVTDAIDLMKEKSIRRILILNEYDNLVAILSNRDILKHIKGNYTRILQNKIKHAQEIMDFLPEPIVEIYYLNNEDIISWMNTQAKNIFGENKIDKSIFTIFTQDDWKKIKTVLTEIKYLKDVSLCLNDSIYEISGTMSKNINTNYIKLIFKDVTTYENEKIKLKKIVDIEIQKRIDSEYLLMQQSKLAIMGEMIGHIAHQWRQPLAQIGGIFMNLESAYDFDELNEKYLDDKLTHGNQLLKYMSATIEDFRHFFEPNRDKNIFNVSKYIDNAINIISASLTYNHIKIDFKKPETEICTIGYPSEFSQVILNILANAQDVLVENKIVNPTISISLRKTKTKIYIEVKDNGGGIPLDIIDNVFDIYFTTKSKQKGSGLGLYMSKLIIESKLLGEIKIQNDDKGAVFMIILPFDE